MDDTEEALINLMLTLTQEMVDYAQAKDWDNLCACEEKRRAHISAFFTRRTSLTQAQRQAIQRIMALDEKTRSLATTGREALGQSIRSVTKGRNVNMAYAATLKHGVTR